MILLTEQERHRFGIYCAEQAHTYNGMVETMTKQKMPAMLAVPIKAKADAYAAVAKELLSTHSG